MRAMTLERPGGPEALCLRDVWTTPGALPESRLTAWGTLGPRDLRPGHRPVIRAATSSVWSDGADRIGGLVGGTAVLDSIVRRVESGASRVVTDRVLPLGEPVAAHRRMEASRATGKVMPVVHHT
ncbi:zinc-binding dehydrogenase [Streptomyces sp. A0958]|uniref:zinc-binding dehydrogenase n=1 Tax=Streptomyces sp. A0958 TaxID=2563101 RepID=UPI001F0FAAD5|nr:zinc-binding dehydrogenase [Streptomyces sp. A0958]